jgi:hypothetical protein
MSIQLWKSQTDFFYLITSEKTEVKSGMDNPETRKTLDARHRTKTTKTKRNTAQKTKQIWVTPTPSSKEKERGLTEVRAKGKQIRVPHRLTSIVKSGKGIVGDRASLYKKQKDPLPFREFC